MRRLSMVKAYFLAVVFLLSANSVCADMYPFTIPPSKGKSFVYLVITQTGSPLMVKVAWGNWNPPEENCTVTPPKTGIVIKLKNDGSDFPTQLTVTATNGIVTKVIPVAEGAIAEWNSPLYASLSW